MGSGGDSVVCLGWVLQMLSDLRHCSLSLLIFETLRTARQISVNCFDLLTTMKMDMLGNVS